MHDGNDQRRWGVTYSPQVRRKAVERRMQTACVALGKNLVWQGVVDIAGAQHVMNFLSACAEREAQLDAEDAAALAPYVEALEALKGEEVAAAGAPASPPPPPPAPPPAPAEKTQPAKPKRKRKPAK